MGMLSLLAFVVLGEQSLSDDSSQRHQVSDSPRAPYWPPPGSGHGAAREAWLRLGGTALHVFVIPAGSQLLFQVS